MIPVIGVIIAIIPPLLTTDCNIIATTVSIATTALLTDSQKEFLCNVLNTRLCQNAEPLFFYTKNTLTKVRVNN
nr:MAG TPA: hypothetical protein [Caudoviricetes sp.]